MWQVLYTVGLRCSPHHEGAMWTSTLQAKQGSWLLNCTTGIWTQSVWSQTLPPTTVLLTTSSKVWARWKHYSRTNLSSDRGGQLSECYHALKWTNHCSIHFVGSRWSLKTLNYNQGPLMGRILLLLELGSISPWMLCGCNGVYINRFVCLLGLCHLAWGISVSWPGLNLHHPALKHGILTTSQGILQVGSILNKGYQSSFLANAFFFM